MKFWTAQYAIILAAFATVAFAAGWHNAQAAEASRPSDPSPATVGASFTGEQMEVFSGACESPTLGYIQLAAPRVSIARLRQTLTEQGRPGVWLEVGTNGRVVLYCWLTTVP